MFIIAEIGINHNGDLNIAKKLIDVAIDAGCNAVKFQKRTPEICIPKKLHNTIKDTPWGKLNYLDYKHRIEFEKAEYDEIDRYCQGKIQWFASCWDIPSVDFISQYNNVNYHKVASACLTDDALLQHIDKQDRIVILSTGMSTLEQICHAVDLFKKCQLQLVLMHTCSAYPSPNDELRLNLIKYLSKVFNLQVGYSGHEIGDIPTLSAVALGADYIERHITLDKTMWGADQSSSLEPNELKNLVKNIKLVQQSLGIDRKDITKSEQLIVEKLRLK
jgi:N-acetylneuraminate synthase